MLVVTSTMMLFYILLQLLLCSSVSAIYNDTEFLPMLDNNKAVLTANIDVSSFNRKMERYISVKVPAQIRGHFEKYISSNRFQNLVKNESMEEINDLANEIIKNMFNSFIKSDEFKNDVHSFAKSLLDDKFDTHVEDADFKEFIKTESKEEIKQLTKNLLNVVGMTKKKVDRLQQDIEALYNPLTDCFDVKRKGFNKSGIYNLILSSATRRVEVYCDQKTQNGGWIVFQRRQDGSQDFYRDWNEYKNGFGNLSGEFWLGNENLHLLTKTGNHRLRIELEDWDGSTAYAEYSSFAIGDETSNYKLTVSGYSGTAGDGIQYNNNKPFSTKDKDNYGANCPVTCVGAWWYHSCTHSNLNGEYLKGEHKVDPHRGVLWYPWKNRFSYSLRSSTMMMKKT